MKKTSLLFTLIVFALGFSMKVNAQTVPVVDSVATIIGVTRTTAFSGCWVKSDGGAAITEKGICFGTASNPTIADSKVLAYKISTPTYEPCAITGLTPNTKYYVRAYATNSVGTSYSTEKEFTTSANDVEAMWVCKANMNATATGLITGTAVNVVNLMTGAIAYDQNSGTSSPTTEITWPTPTGWSKLTAGAFSLATFSSTVYTSFSVTPNYTLNINKFVLSALGYKSGAMKIRIDYSFDDFATAGTTLLNATSNTSSKTLTANGEVSLSTANPLLTVEMGKENISYTPNIIVPGGQTIYFRMYIWGKANSGIMLKNMVISGKTLTTFSGTGDWTETARWNLGAVPSAADNVYIDGTAVVSTSANVGNILINTGKSLTVNPGKGLTVNGNMVNNGTLTLQSDTSGTATIVIPTAITGSGTTNVQQYLTSGRNWYVSSPVEAAQTSTITNLMGGNMISYDEIHGSTTLWRAESSGLTPAKGYILQSPVNDKKTVVFTGALNTGDKSVALTHTVGQNYEGFNLVGNPYPSNVTWTESLATASNTISTIWFRTYASNAYAFHTFNATGKVGSPVGVTGQIPPMQAFWVWANTGGGTLTFNNSMRSHSATPNLLKSAAVESNKVLRMQVSNQIHSDEAVVYFNEAANDDFDLFDSPKMEEGAPDFPEICTKVGLNKLVINGMNGLKDNLEVPLAFTCGQKGVFSLKATEFSNFQEGVSVLLKDLYLNKVVDLSLGSVYTFNSEPVSSSDRFALVFKTTSNTTGLAQNWERSFQIYTNENNQIVVNNTGAEAGLVTVCVVDNLGRTLSKTCLTNETTVLDQRFAPGMYLVVLIKNGQKVVNKLMVK